jgi:hypothetical protein
VFVVLGLDGGARRDNRVTELDGGDRVLILAVFAAGAIILVWIGVPVAMAVRRGIEDRLAKGARRT